MLESAYAGLWITAVSVACSIVAWEWKKVLDNKKLEAALADRMTMITNRMDELHRDHQSLLTSQANEHAEVMRGMTTALNNLNMGIKELTYYIKWLGKTQGTNIPPPIGMKTDS